MCSRVVELEPLIESSLPCVVMRIVFSYLPPLHLLGLLRLNKRWFGIIADYEQHLFRPAIPPLDPLWLKDERGACTPKQTFLRWQHQRFADKEVMRSIAALETGGPSVSSAHRCAFLDAKNRLLQQCSAQDSWFAMAPWLSRCGANIAWLWPGALSFQVPFFQSRVRSVPGSRYCVSRTVVEAISGTRDAIGNEIAPPCRRRVVLEVQPTKLRNTRRPRNAVIADALHQPEWQGELYPGFKGWLDLLRRVLVCYGLECPVHYQSCKEFRPSTAHCRVDVQDHRVFQVDANSFAGRRGNYPATTGRVVFVMPHLWDSDVPEFGWCYTTSLTSTHGTDMIMSAYQFAEHEVPLGSGQDFAHFDEESGEQLNGFVGRGLAAALSSLGLLVACENRGCVMNESESVQEDRGQKCCFLLCPVCMRILQLAGVFDDGLPVLQRLYYLMELSPVSLLPGNRSALDMLAQHHGIKPFTPPHNGAGVRSYLSWDWFHTMRPMWYCGRYDHPGYAALQPETQNYQPGCCSGRCGPVSGCQCKECSEMTDDAVDWQALAALGWEGGETL